MTYNRLDGKQSENFKFNSDLTSRLNDGSAHLYGAAEVHVGEGVGVQSRQQVLLLYCGTTSCELQDAVYLDLKRPSVNTQHGGV